MRPQGTERRCAIRAGPLQGTRRPSRSPARPVEPCANILGRESVVITRAPSTRRPSPFDFHRDVATLSTPRVRHCAAYAGHRTSLFTDASRADNPDRNVSRHGPAHSSPTASTSVHVVTHTRASPSAHVATVAHNAPSIRSPPNGRSAEPPPTHPPRRPIPRPSPEHLAARSAQSNEL
jgi:hypothetical protein